MFSRQLLAATVVASILGTASAWGDEVRYYAENGITYCETRRTVQRPVVETCMQPCPQTVYRAESSTELRQVTCSRWVPITEYRAEAAWVGRWNPFVEPYQVTRYVPYTRWEQRTETVQVPVACTRLVPQTQNVQVPVTAARTVSQEVVTRVAVSSAPCAVAGVAAAAPSPAGTAGVPVGGVARLDKDPPRWSASGVNPAPAAATAH